MAKIKMKPVSALMKFFERKPGQTLTEFSEEVKQLSPEEKLWMAEECCKELGVELDV